MVTHGEFFPAGRFVSERAHAPRFKGRPRLGVRFEEKPPPKDNAEECLALIQPVSAKHRPAADTAEVLQLIQYEFLETRLVHRG